MAFRHLIKSWHDVVHKVTEIWCPAGGWDCPPRYKPTDEPALCDCRACLEEAARFGFEAVIRLTELQN